MTTQGLDTVQLILLVMDLATNKCMEPKGADLISKPPIINLVSDVFMPKILNTHQGAQDNVSNHFANRTK